MKAIDITGQTINGIYVESRAENNKYNRTRWNCICYCGNRFVTNGYDLRSGKTKSCGCLQKQRTSEANLIDIVGNVYGRLTVLEKYQNRKCHDMLWLCKCECGNTTLVSTTALKNGDTRSCGCYRKEATSMNSRKDLSNMRFGKLVAIKPVGMHRGQVTWDCLCDCGNHKITTAVDLLRGHAISCGCAKSAMECEISHFLDKHHIVYEYQKRFIMCRDVNPLVFDFYLPDYNLAVEYDGEMHYQETSLGNNLGAQQRRDAIKTKYCEENDIILLRIPYWEKDNIESILNDWLFLYDTEEANSSDVDLSA